MRILLYFLAQGPLRLLNLITPDQLLAVHLAPMDLQSFLAGMISLLIFAHVLKNAATTLHRVAKTPTRK